MDKKRVLVVTQHPLLRESLRSLPMPNVDVVVTDHLPTADEEIFPTEVWIVDCAMVPCGTIVSDLFHQPGAPRKIVLVAVDAPEVYLISRHSLHGVDAAAFLEKLVLASEEE